MLLRQPVSNNAMYGRYLRGLMAALCVVLLPATTSAQMERSEDEFDFRKRIGEVGLKKALKERDEVYAGRYWGW